MTADIAKILVFAALISGIAWASNKDFEDEQAADQRYCEMVKSKAWRDYRAFYREKCE
jgi:hypothetical protein